MSSTTSKLLLLKTEPVISKAKANEASAEAVEARGREKDEERPPWLRRSQFRAPADRLDLEIV